MMDITQAKYNADSTSVEISDGDRTLFVPINAENRHYQQLLKWEAEGNTIEAWVPPTQVELDAAQDARLDAIENTIDATESSEAALYAMTFDLENRVRVIEGVAPMTKRDFKKEFRKQLRVAARKAERAAQ